MGTEKMDVLDVVISVLKEHEKALDEIVSRLENVLVQIGQHGVSTATVNLKVKAQPEDTINFVDEVGRALSHLPQGVDFEIPRVEHTAHVKITKTEPNTCKETEKRNWIKEAEKKNWIERLKAWDKDWEKAFGEREQ